MSLYPASGSLTGGRSQGRSGLAGADCLSPCALPARAWPPQDCGAPFGSPRSGPPFKLAVWLLPLVLLDREQAQAIAITVLPFNSSDPVELPLCFQGNLEQTDQWGVGNLLPPALP